MKTPLEQLFSDLKSKARVLKLEIEAKKNELSGLEGAIWETETALDREKKEAAGQ